MEDDLFNDYQYIEYDEESNIWQPIDPHEFIEQTYQINQQLSQEEHTPPTIIKIKKTSSRPRQMEVWTHQRVAPNVVSLSNTKFLRECVSKELLPPNSYVILPVQEYQAFRCGAKDFKFGSKCIILIDPSHCLGSVMDFGKELDQHFGFTSPEDTVNS